MDYVVTKVIIELIKSMDMTLTHITRLKTYLLYIEKGGGNFCMIREHCCSSIVAILLIDGWGISGMKERYLIFYASGD